MAYYLGRDLDFALTTENVSYGIITAQGAAVGIQIAELRDFAEASSVSNYDESAMTGGGAGALFAGPKLQTSNTVFGEMEATITATAENWTNRPANITGLDLSVSTQDEDVQFIGQRNVLKAEVKKENSVTITRKKKDEVWNVAFNAARFGVAEAPTGDGSVGDGAYQPDFTGYGYRLYIRLATGATGECLVLPNCCITEYTVSLSPDASQEESLTFISYVNPLIITGEDSTDQVGALIGGM
jgi:hypothetical protein